MHSGPGPAAMMAGAFVAALAAAPAHAQGGCPDGFYRSCSCPSGCNSESCEKYCSWYLTAPNGRCLYTCGSCGCELPAKAADVTLAQAGDTESIDPAIQEFRNADGDFMLIDPARVPTMKEAAGIGANIVAVSSGALVSSVRKSGPAAKAKIKSGDVIVSIDGKQAAGLGTSEAGELLRGSAGTKVRVGVSSAKSGKVVEYTLTRRNYSSFAAKREGLSLKTFPAKDLGGKCPKEKDGCNFLYQDGESCNFTCRN